MALSWPCPRRNNLLHSASNRLEGEKEETLTSSREPEPSPAELFERFKQKVTAGDATLGPAVAEAIQHLKRIKAFRSEAEGDEEYRTVNDLDLRDAITKGVAVKVEALTEEARWELVIHGPDRGGETLVVMGYLERDANLPAQIVNFTFPQS